jgi:cell division protein FtsN
MRVKPENPGGMKLSSDMTIFGGGADDKASDKLAPGPEQPDPQALKPAAPPPSATAAQPALAGAAAPVASALPEPAPKPIASAPLAPVPAKPVALPPLHGPATAPAAEPHSVAAAPTAGAGGRMFVQLAALSSKEQAEAEWKQLARRAPALLESRAPSISEANVNGRSWWRVRTGGFADEAQARSFCEKLHASGIACSVARF